MIFLMDVGISCILLMLTKVPSFGEGGMISIFLFKFAMNNVVITTYLFFYEFYFEVMIAISLSTIALTAVYLTLYMLFYPLKYVIEACYGCANSNANPKNPNNIHFYYEFYRDCHRREYCNRRQSQTKK